MLRSIHVVSQVVNKRQRNLWLPMINSDCRAIVYNGYVRQDTVLVCGIPLTPASPTGELGS